MSIKLTEITEDQLNELIDMAFEMNILWMTEIINRAVWNEVRADEAYKVMSPAEIEANGRFAKLLTTVRNPHTNEALKKQRESDAAAQKEGQ